MPLSELIISNLLSPAILCFVLGAASIVIRSDLKLPEAAYAALSIYLMLAIGMKGGMELSGRSLNELAAPLTVAMAVGTVIPLWCFWILRTMVGLSVADAAALSAHYGSVSAVTFAAVVTMLDRQQIAYEGYAPALLAVMELPAIIVAIALAGIANTVASSTRSGETAVAALGASQNRFSIYDAVGDALSSKSVLLLAGGLLIGFLCGPQGIAKVKPVFVDLFQGMLCLFLLELGRVAASRIDEFRLVGQRLAAFAIAMPVLHGALGIVLAYGIGLSQGGAIILGTLCASASYIAAPAAVRLALPEANPSYYLTCSLAITFPFNITLGIPLYVAFAAFLYA